MSQELINLVEQSSLKAEAPQFEIGDTVDVHTKILEGQKERVQVFTGTVIGLSGQGAMETFTVRRMVAGEGVERKFPIHSPRVAKVEVKRSGVVRRAKLYFLRDRVGKAVRLKERRRTTKKSTSTHKRVHLFSGPHVLSVGPLCTFLEPKSGPFRFLVGKRSVTGAQTSYPKKMHGTKLISIDREFGTLDG